MHIGRQTDSKIERKDKSNMVSRLLKEIIREERMVKLSVVRCWGGKMGELGHATEHVLTGLCQVDRIDSKHFLVEKYLQC